MNMLDCGTFPRHKLLWASPCFHAQEATTLSIDSRQELISSICFLLWYLMIANYHASKCECLPFQKNRHTNGRIWGAPTSREVMHGRDEFHANHVVCIQTKRLIDLTLKTTPGDMGRDDYRRWRCYRRGIQRFFPSFVDFGVSTKPYFLLYSIGTYFDLQCVSLNISSMLLVGIREVPRSTNKPLCCKEQFVETVWTIWIV